MVYADLHLLRPLGLGWVWLLAKSYNAGRDHHRHDRGNSSHACEPTRSGRNGKATGDRLGIGA